MVYVSRYAYRMQEPRDWTPVAHVVALDEGDARFFRPEQRTRYLIEKRNNQRAEVSAVYQVRKAEMSHSTARRWGLITEILGGDFSIEMANAARNVARNAALGSVVAEPVIIPCSAIAKITGDLLKKRVRVKDGRVGTVVSAGNGFYTIRFDDGSPYEKRRRGFLELIDCESSSGSSGSAMAAATRDTVVALRANKHGCAIRVPPQSAVVSQASKKRKSLRVQEPTAPNTSVRPLAL